MLGAIYEICCGYHPAIGLVYAPLSPIATALVSRIFFAVLISRAGPDGVLSRELRDTSRGGMLKRLAWLKRNRHALPLSQRIGAYFVRFVSVSGFLALAWSLAIIFGPALLYERPL